MNICRGRCPFRLGCLVDGNWFRWCVPHLPGRNPFLLQDFPGSQTDGQPPALSFQVRLKVLRPSSCCPRLDAFRVRGGEAVRRSGLWTRNPLLAPPQRFSRMISQIPRNVMVFSDAGVRPSTVWVIQVKFLAQDVESARKKSFQHG